MSVPRGNQNRSEATDLIFARSVTGLCHHPKWSSLMAAPIVVICQIPMYGIFCRGLIEREIERVFVLAVRHAVTGRAKADEIALAIMAALPTRDIVVQMERATIAAEDARVAIAGIYGLAGFGADAFGCVEHGVVPPFFKMHRNQHTTARARAGQGGRVQPFCTRAT